jgi:putative nucleotidyltransferase with HDIG domain
VALEHTRQIDQTGKLPWAHLRLPPLSQVALRVLQLATNENVQLHELSDLISSDPALASEVLTIVNSLVYAPRFPINSILQAIAVMGANHLQGLCLTVGVRGYMGQTLSQPAMRALWRHNLACAAIAEQIALAGFMDHDIAFTCGIMHDIGRLALAVVRPREYTALLATHIGPAASILDREEEIFGKNHCQIGSQLVADWRLPDDFEPIVAGHHDQRLKDGPWGMTELIAVSCRMADAAGFAAFSLCRPDPFADLLDELPVRERKLFHTDVETLTLEVSKKITAIESI